MGRIIQQNNGKTTIYVTGEDFNNLTATADTYYVGVDLTTGKFEKINPDGSFEEFAGGSYSSVTYSELYNLFTGETLNSGSYYLINDFQTCYDQPDFDQNGDAIVGNNYKTGTTEPILVLSTGVNSLSPKAYSLEYPLDDISYDISFTVTERTGNPAKGRITERIDERGNRTDYDFRSVLFKRYDFYYSENYYSGTLSIDSGGFVTGSDTDFSNNFRVGDVLGVYEGSFSNPTGCFRYYEILTISGATEMTVTGNTIQSYNNVPYSRGIQFNEYRSFHQTNIISNTAYTEYFTFEAPEVFNVKIGNYANLYNEQENPFLLSNNVFLDGSYLNITIGDESYDNTFDEDMNALSIGNNCYRNIITNDFEESTIGHYFRNNIIICDMQDNQIGNYFQYNMLGDYDGPDFDQNRIGNYFQANFITFADNDFFKNDIGDNFNQNLINTSFQNNHITVEFSNNRIDGSFNDNKVGSYFYDNNVYQDFNDNSIGNNFNNNTIYSSFYKNEILNNFNNITIGDSGNTSNFEFYENKIGNNFNNNTIRQNFQNNQIGNDFESNTLNGNFFENVIGNNFYNNPNIGYNFYGNHIGNDFESNELIGDYFQNNEIGNYFYSNGISYLFSDNQIGNTFENNTLGDTQFFNWDNTKIENLTGRTYNTFYNSLYGEDGEAVGKVILGKELIMRFLRNSGTTITSGDLVIGETYEITNYQGSDDFSNVADVISGDINTNGCIFIATGTTPTEWSSNSELTELTSYDEYHKVKFTQWTQGGNGGGFSYERTKVYPTVESVVYFTKTNYENVVDIIIPGRLEIRRNNGGAIYNDVLENSWNQNESPLGTQWNSIYTQPFNGSEFGSNTIFGDFKGNYIRGDFAGNKIDSDVGGNEFSGNTYLNNIGIATFDNDFLGDVYGNNWVGPFYLNVIGDSFESNSFGNGTYNNTIGEDFFSNNIKENFYDNTIGNGFQTNQIGSYFNNNNIDDYFGYGYGDPQGNKIGSNFYNNTVGEYFYNNTIPDNFEQNIIGEYFQWNIINTKIDNTDFTINYGNITGFSYTATGRRATDDIYTGLVSTTNGIGVDATFNVEVSGGEVISVTENTEGRFYTNGDVLTILGTQIGGETGTIDGFSSDGVGKSGTTGSYTNIFATGTGGENATFDIDVAGDVVTDIYLNDGGGSYSVNETLTILGSEFGGVDGVDDITITVTSLYSDDVIITVTGTTPTSLFYEHYTKQIFERRLGDKRTSFYDEDDILNIGSVYENSGYIPVYSQSLTYPINDASFEFWCDGSYSNDTNYTGVEVNNSQGLVNLFNSNYRQYGYFFDNNDGTIGLYINPSLKKQYCPTGTYTINVFSNIV